MESRRVAFEGRRDYYYEDIEKLICSGKSVLNKNMSSTHDGDRG